MTANPRPSVRLRAFCSFALAGVNDRAALARMLAMVAGATEFPRHEAVPPQTLLREDFAESREEAGILDGVPFERLGRGERWAERRELLCARSARDAYSVLPEPFRGFVLAVEKGHAQAEALKAFLAGVGIEVLATGLAQVIRSTGPKEARRLFSQRIAGPLGEDGQDVGARVGERVQSLLGAPDDASGAAWPAEAWLSAFELEARRLAAEEATARRVSRIVTGMRRRAAYYLGRRFVSGWIRAELSAAGVSLDGARRSTLTVLTEPEPLPIATPGPLDLERVRRLVGLLCVQASLALQAKPGSPHER